ncbi:MAG: MFS transporter [Chloroflexi bacterium]|nr:MFS transporter [Chloroflexota bacterium]
MLVGLAYAAFISLGLPDGLTGVAWPSIRTTFNLPLDALGALVTTGTIGYMLSSFSSGRVLARIGVGWLLVLSCLATAISLLGYGAAPLWLVMVGLGLLAGFGAGAIDAGLNTYAAENFSPRTMNWLHAAFGLGAATGPIIMSSVISAGYPWRVGYLIVGVAQLILASCFAITRSQWHAHTDEAQAEPVASAPMARTLMLPAAWLSILLFFLYTGLEITAGQWMYTLLTEARGLVPAIAGVWVSVYWGSLTVGRLLSGMIVAHISVRTLLQICMVGAILGVVLFWLNITAWLSLIGVSMLGLSLAPMFPSLISLTPGRMGPAHAANTVGFQIAAATLGGAILLSSFGLLADQFGLEQLGPFLLAVAVLMTLVFEILERQPRPGDAQS